MIKTYLHDAGRVGDGFKDEINDCGIRAYAIAKEIPYHEVHAIFEPLRRLDGRIEISAVRRIFGRPEDGSFRLVKGSTLTAFLARFPTGIFFAFTNRHAFCIKDGIVFDDRKHTGRTRIMGYWKI